MGCGFGLAIGIDLDVVMFVDRGNEHVCFGWGMRFWSWQRK